MVVDSYQTLVETAAFFAKAGAPKAKGLGVIASSGGFAVLAADQAEARGVPLPQPGETTRAILEAAIPEIIASTSVLVKRFARFKAMAYFWLAYISCFHNCLS